MADSVRADGGGSPSRAAVAVLGPLQVALPDGSLVSPGRLRTRKTRHLLRLLALADGKPLRGAGLIELLWPDVPPERARASLRTAASQIRTVLGRQWLVREPTGLALHGVEVDAVRFEDLSARARSLATDGDVEQAFAAARAALALYRGDVAEDEPDLPPLQVTQERFRLLRVMTLFCAAESALAIGRSDDAIDAATTILQDDPASERACRIVMEAAHRQGDTTRALRAFTACRQALAEELGTQPSAATEQLYLRLLSDR